MTSRPGFVPPKERAQSVGATGGLSGANADPRTAELAPEEIESTVAAGDMRGDAAPDPADELAAGAPDEHDHGLHTGDPGPDDESADGSARIAGGPPSGGQGAAGAEGSEGSEGEDLRRREGDLDADGGEADAEAATQAGLS
jgi:hypothetical protein